MKTSQAGFVLIMVLVLLEILSILGLYALVSGMTEQKMTRHYWQAYVLSEAAEQILATVEQNDFSTCTIAVTPPGKLLQQPLPWWQAVSCAGNFALFQYYYVVESMGIDSCTRVGDLSANYFRITLCVLPKVGLGQKILLQSVIVKGGAIEQSCQEASHVVQLGRQSWRELR